MESSIPNFLKKTISEIDEKCKEEIDIIESIIGINSKNKEKINQIS